MQKTLNKLSLNQQGHPPQPPSLIESVTLQLTHGQPVYRQIICRLTAFIGKKMRVVPAAQAVLIQCAALMTVLASAKLTVWLTENYLGAEFSISMFSLVLMQALFAALYSTLAGMARWWRWIHLAFPVAAWGLSQWQVPNELYLVGFVVSLSLFWTTFRTQVPFFPSRPIVWQQVAKIIPQTQVVRLIDIGSGLGDMPMYIAKARPESQIEGIEIAPLPWVISYIRAKLRRSSASFKLGDYTALDFAHYDVIFAYLSPAAMLNLWEKASHEMRPGSLLISLEFEIPGITPSMCIAGNQNAPALYVWKIT